MEKGLNLKLINSNNDIEILEVVTSHFRDSLSSTITIFSDISIPLDGIKTQPLSQLSKDILSKITPIYHESYHYLPLNLSNRYYIQFSTNEECWLFDFLSELQSIAESISHKNGSSTSYKSKFQQLEIKYKQLEVEHSNRTNQMIYLLNHTSQGFLTFGYDLIVEEESSYECMNIFNTFVGNRYFPQLLYPQNLENQEFIKKLLKKILNETDNKKRSVYQTLLPKQLELEGKVINCNFITIYDFSDQRKHKFMLILTDVTKEKELEREMESEKNILTMVVKSVVDYNDLMYTIRQYRSFVEKLENEIERESNDIERFFVKFFRKLHTFKGNFSQLNMVNTTPSIDQLETEISSIEESLHSITKEELKDYFKKINFFNGLNQDMEILKSILSEAFFSQDSKLIIYSDKIDELVTKIKALLPQFESKLVEAEIRKLARKPFSRIFQPLISYTHKIAEERGVLIEQIYLDGGNFFTDIEYYSEFVKTLIHIFRNAIVHGIEPPDERVMMDKDEFGNIFINIERSENSIILEVGDDGRGLDSELLKARAIEIELYKEEQINNMNRDQLLDLIFVDKFSTSDEVTTLSGRGVGMSAVKEELLKLGGNYSIKSEKSVGTTFRFTIPLKEEITLKKRVHISEIMEPVINTIKEYLEFDLDIDIIEMENFKISPNNYVKMGRYGSILRLSGIIQGNFILTGDEKLIEKLAEGYMGEVVNADDIELVLAEQLNIIIGNSIRKFSGIEDLVDIDSPFIIESDETKIKYLDTYIYNCDIVTTKGVLHISFVTSKNSEILIGIEDN